jgi:hypothetical protein
VTGLGQIGTGSATPGSDLQTFDFDVRADLTGTLTYTDYSSLVNGGALVLRATDITAFRNGSSMCSDPTRGAEFDGIAQVEGAAPSGSFTVGVCDNGPPGSGLDFFIIVTPSSASPTSYSRSGNETGGDIAKSSP